MQQKIVSAEAAMDAGNFNEAIQHYQSLLKDEPENVMVLQGFAECLRRLGRYEEALQNALIAAQIDPSLGSIRATLGIIYSNRNQYKEAENELRNAIALNPTDSESYGNLGGVLIEQNHVEEGILLLHHAVAMKADIWWFHFNLFFGYIRQRRLREALREAWKTFRLRPALNVVARILNNLEATYTPFPGIILTTLYLISIFALPVEFAFIIPSLMVVYDVLVGVGLWAIKKERSGAVRRFAKASIFLLIGIIAYFLKSANS